MLTFSIDPVTGYPTDFTMVNHCPASLAVGATCTVDISFAPVLNGYPHTNLVISGTDVPRYVDLMGTEP